MEETHMKRLTAFVLTVIMIASAVSGAVVIYADGDAVLSQAGQLLYGMYTKQSGDRLRDSYCKAVADGSAENIAALTDAVDNLVPLASYVHHPLLGFDGITADDIFGMPLNKGDVSVSEGTISISGTGELRYCNAAEEGISGQSPFGVEMISCDGIVLTVTSDAEGSLYFETGRRGSPDDCRFGIDGIYVAEGENVYLFPLESFGNIPLDGTLNYISLTFTGMQNVSFNGLHAAESTAETAAKTVKTVSKLTAPEFDKNKFYKIAAKGKEQYLSYDPDGSETAKMTFAARDDDDEAQEWQICNDPDVPARKRIINRKYGEALTILSNPTGLKCKTPSLRDMNQQWGVGFQARKGFSFYVPETGRLDVKDGKAKASAISASVVYFDVYEITSNEEWNLAWQDDFDTLDRSVWTVFDAKNRGDMEPMYNRDSPNNVYIEDGNLVIKTIKEEYEGYHATSGYLSSEFNVHFTFGRIDVYAKMPEGTKIWPAVWMMGDDDDWPFSGEFDVVEMTGGEENSVNRGDAGVLGTFHFANDTGYHQETGGGNETFYNTEKLAYKYHTYSMEWDANYLRWYFDGIMYHSKPYDSDVMREALTKNPAYLILDTSIDGPGDNELPEGMPDESYFYIDRISYYKKSTSAVPEDTGSGALNIKPVLDTSIAGVARAPKFSAENGLYILPSYTQMCAVYDMNTAEQKTVLSVPDTGTTEQTQVAAISPDGKHIAYGSARKFIAIFSYPEGNLEKIITDVHMHCGKLEFSADGRYLFLVTRPSDNKGIEYAKKMHIFSVATGEEVSTVDVSGWGSVIKSAADGSVAVGLYNGTLKVLNSDFTVRFDKTLSGGISNIEFSGDSSVVYAGCGNGTLYAVDAADGGIRQFDTVSSDEIYHIAVSPDGSRVSAAYGDGSARIFDAQSGKLVNRVATGPMAATGSAFSPDGKLLAVSSDNSKVVVASSDGSRVLAVLTSDDTPKCNFDCVTFNSDGSMVYSSRNRLPFNCGICGWQIPDGLAEEYTPADFSALEAEDTYTDELLWSEESYAAYLAAEKQAQSVLTNRYSTQNQIDTAAASLKEAKDGLEERTSVMKGDFDNDGQITVADALAALRIGAKLVEETPESIAIGDTDNDGHVTVADALAILRVAAKLADSL